MAVVTGEVLVYRVNVEEAVAFGIELFQLLAAALGEDDVAGVAVARLNFGLAVSCLVKPVVAAKTSGPFFVAEVIGIGPPVRFHLWKEIVSINPLGSGDQ